MGRRNVLAVGILPRSHARNDLRHALAQDGAPAPRPRSDQWAAGVVGEDGGETPSATHSIHQEVISADMAMPERQLVDRSRSQVLGLVGNRERTIKARIVVDAECANID